MKRKVGLALCGSYCTYATVFAELEHLCDQYDIVPIMSENAAVTDTRFGKAEDFKARLEELTGRVVIETIAAAAPPHLGKNARHNQSIGIQRKYA